MKYNCFLFFIFEKKQISEYGSAFDFIANDDNIYYFLTNDNAPNYKVVSSKKFKTYCKEKFKNSIFALGNQLILKKVDRV